jgi:hypothetical protein
MENEMKKFSGQGGRYLFLSDAIAACTVKGLSLEFGVADGHSINYIADNVPGKIYGFDSFAGLPEYWKPGDEKGCFARSTLPDVRKNVDLVVGLFEDTLPNFVKMHSEPISFMHVDCDLYSSTKTVLRWLHPQIVSGTIIVFDEYETEHEQKAFEEYIFESKWSVEPLAVCDERSSFCMRELTQ